MAEQYTIKPLEWSYDGYGCWLAFTSIGVLRVHCTYDVSGDYTAEMLPSTARESSKRCRTADDAKAECESRYVERMRESLVLAGETP